MAGYGIGYAHPAGDEPPRYKIALNFLSEGGIEGRQFGQTLKIPLNSSLLTRNEGGFVLPPICFVTRNP